MKLTFGNDKEKSCDEYYYFFVFNGYLMMSAAAQFVPATIGNAVPEDRPKCLQDITLKRKSI